MADYQPIQAPEARATSRAAACGLTGTRRHVAYALLGVLVVAGAVLGTIIGVSGDDRPATPAFQMDSGRAYIVETIPLNMSDIELVPGGKHTHTALLELIDGTQSTLDVTVFYWDLIASNTDYPDDPKFTPEQFEALGSGYGAQLYAGFQRAAARGVQIRFLNGELEDSKPEEAYDLADAYDNVEVRTMYNEDWYGGGVMHQKIWISDGAAVYVGSANMDWLSLSQVKELGVLTYDTPALAADVTKLFDTWWAFAAMDAEPVWANSTVFDAEFLQPCWSPMVPKADRCDNPFGAERSAYGVHSPMPIELNNDTGSVFVSMAPETVLSGSRTFDQTAIANTIYSSTRYVKLSVMDFLDQSIFSSSITEQPVWWPAFTDPILTQVYQDGVDVKLLLSHWNHTSARMDPALRALQATADVCAVADTNNPTCSGSLEIRLYMVPGWNDTLGAHASYPPYSRVNHAKYALSDQMISISTSNFAWSYFYTTAGASFNSDNADLRASLEAVFDRDWDSPYAVPLEEFSREYPYGDVVAGELVV